MPLSPQRIRTTRVAAAVLAAAGWLAAPRPCRADPWDPGDNTAAGTPSSLLPNGSWQSHGPHTLDDFYNGGTDTQDWFRVYMSAGQTYHFDCRDGGYADSIIDVYLDPTSFSLASNDWTIPGCGLNPSLEFTPTVGGTYYIRLTEYSGVTATEYLNYWIVPSVGNPIPFTPRVETGPSAGVPCVQYHFTGFGEDPRLDLISYEWDIDGDGVTDRFGMTNTYCRDELYLSFPVPGTYPLRVRIKDVTGQYSSWSAYHNVVIANPPGSGNDAGKGVDAGDDRTTSLSIGGPGTQAYTAEMEPCESYDYYKFYVVAGTPITIDLTPVAGLDLNIDLYQDFTFKASSHNLGGGVSEHIAFTADVSGLYYLVVSKYTYQGYGAYAFSISGAIAPADLHSILTLAPSPSNIGMWFEARLLVTNTGDNAAANVTPSYRFFRGSGLTVFQSGPLPSPSVASLAPGASASFTWTFSASGAGGVGFSFSATGTDAAIPSVTTTGPAAGTMLLQVPALLGGMIVPAGPMSVKDGATLTVLLTVTNEGGAAAAGVTLFAGSSAPALVAPSTGPLPGGFTQLAGYFFSTFSWTFNVIGAPGTVTVTATMSGADANSGNPLLFAATTGPITLIPAAVLVPSISVAPTTLHQGEFAIVTMTTTNVGSANAIRMAQRLPLIPPALVTIVSGPLTGTVDIASGGGVSTTSWLLQAVVPGTQGFTATASGIDAGDLSRLAVGAPGGCVILPLVAATLQLSSMMLKHGDVITAMLTLSNTGSISATLAMPSVTFDDPAGGSVVTGPAPTAGALLMPGQIATWVWTLKILKSGRLTISAGAAGIANGVPILPTGAVTVAADTRFPVELGAFPNPVSGDVLTVTIKPDRPADRVMLEVYNTGRDRVYAGVWRDVSAVDQDLVITGVKAWAPGLYFVRAHAEFPDGRRQEFALLKVAVKR